jgi:hypothetical protein
VERINGIQPGVYSTGPETIVVKNDETLDAGMLALISLFTQTTKKTVPNNDLPDLKDKPGAEPVPKKDRPKSVVIKPEQRSAEDKKKFRKQRNKGKKT